MNNIHSLLFKKTNPKAVLPTRQHTTQQGIGNSGYDLQAIENVRILSKDSAVVPVGLTLAHMPPGYWIRIESRSGLAFKHNITAFNGIIDNNYRGDLGVKLFNHGNSDYEVLEGDRIAQLVLYPLVDMFTPDWSEEVSLTDRGNKGHGSTGK